MKMKFRPNLIFLCLTALLSTSCTRSEDKIAEAQSKYRELVTAHNAVTDAYAQISDDSLYEELSGYESTLAEYRTYNLYDMDEEEIDALIATMNHTLNEYKDYLVTIDSIRQAEDALILVPLSFTLVNNTTLSFDSLTLRENGDTNAVTDLLDENSPFTPSSGIVGLTVYEDVDHTPWVMALHTAAEDNGEEVRDSYEIALLPDELTDGIVLYLLLNEDSGELSVSEQAPE